MCFLARNARDSFAVYRRRMAQLECFCQRSAPPLIERRRERICLRVFNRVEGYTSKDPSLS